MKKTLNSLIAACLAGATLPAAAQIQTPASPAPLAQDYTVVFHNPDPEYYVEGPGLVKQDDGALVAIVPVVPRHAWSKERRMENSRIHILHSLDAGATWRKRSTLPYYSAVPWIHKGTLYLFANTPGTEFRNDDLLLLSSGDNGKTWSEPVTLFKGHFWNCHTGMVIRDGRIYWALDDLGFGANRGPLVVMGDLTMDPMDPKAWRRSNAVPFPGIPDAMVNQRFSDQDSLYLEPNVIDVGGKLRVLATVKPQNQTTANLCAVFDLTEEAGELSLKFVQFSPMPGGQLKFTVLWDETSQMFWSTANLVADSQQRYRWWTDSKDGKLQGSPFGGNDRRFLMLQYSVDGLNWFQAGCVARAGKVSQSFMYARPIIDGDDLAIISRTSIDAPNQHDADHATFHRVKNFRKTALNLFPDASE